MPIGSYAAVPLLAQRLLRLRPQSVLDLGMGFGGCGAAVREWLDAGVRPWKTYLAGVEAWADYRNPVWDLYDVVYVQTIEDFLRLSSEAFDCVLLGDVLEHFEKEAGRQVLLDIQPRVAPDGCLLVTTPAHFFSQEAVYGNAWERHRSYWSAEELAALGFAVERAGQPELFCGECWFAEWRR
jgi:predicted TPR repeat methyltransferase